MPLLTLAIVPALAFALCAASLPLTMRLARRLGIIAVPRADSRHREPTPLLGGLSINAAIVAAFAFAGGLRGPIALGVLGLFAVGFIDDAIALRPLRKFLMQLAVIVAVVAAGPPHLGLARWPLVSEAMAVFWLTSTANAFNLIDGLDGLAGGVGIAAALSIAAIGAARGAPTMTLQGLAIAGALGGFLLFNLHPAAIFMGDCGALPLGYLLGALALHAGSMAASSRLSQYAVPALIMLAPLLDAAIVSVSRVATGNPVSRRGLDHSHHRLLALGLSDRRVVAVCWSVAALSGGCAAVLAAMPHAYVVTVLPAIAALFALVGLFMIDLTFDARAPGIAYSYMRGTARHILSLSYKRRITEAALDAIIVTAAYFGAFLIRLDFTIDDAHVRLMLASLPWVVGASYAAFLCVGVYRGIWRYAGMSDVMRFVNGAVLAGIFVVVASAFAPISLSGSIAVLFVILLMNLLVASRLSFRALRKGIALLAAPEERVLIVGAGGLGSPVLLYLAAAGVGTIGLIDHDRLDLSNLQRQIAHTTARIGRSKVASAAETAKAINPGVAIEPYDARLDAGNALDLVGRYDLVCDGTDNFATRFLLADACVLARRTLVSAAVLRFEGQLSTFKPHAGPDAPCYRCLYPEPPPPGLVPSCSEAGVFGAVTGVMGTLQATEALKEILGIGESLSGTLLLWDALAARFQRIRLRRDPACPLCGAAATIRDLSAHRAAAEPACAV
jgi:adenylyltransferase/sulfurtransferase